MKEFLKNYGLPIVEAVSSLLLIAVTIWMSIWMPEAAQEDEFNIISFAYIFWDNLTNLKSPIPYFIAISILSLLGRVEGMVNRYYYGQISIIQSELEIEKGKLTEEASAHGESKSSYYETLQKALAYLLRTEDFNAGCRVTVYQKKNGDDTRLHRVFRYSPHKSLESEGRLTVPLNEGVVGAAWKNDGELEFSHQSNPRSATFKAEIERRLAVERCGVPNVDLSMESRYFYAKRIYDTSTGERVAIVVYESVDHDRLSKAKLDAVLNNDAIDLARFISHLGALHDDFQPISRRMK